MKYEFFSSEYDCLATINFSKDDFEKLLRNIYFALNQIEKNKCFNFKNLSTLKKSEKSIFLLLIDHKNDLDKNIKKKLIKELQKKNSNLFIYRNSTSI